MTRYRAVQGDGRGVAAEADVEEVVVKLVAGIGARDADLEGRRRRPAACSQQARTSRPRVTDERRFTTMPSPCPEGLATVAFGRCHASPPNSGSPSNRPRPGWRARSSGWAVTTRDAVPSVRPYDLEARSRPRRSLAEEDDPLDVAHAQDLARLQAREIATSTTARSTGILSGQLRMTSSRRPSSTAAIADHAVDQHLLQQVGVAR